MLMYEMFIVSGEHTCEAREGQQLTGRGWTGDMAVDKAGVKAVASSGAAIGKLSADM